MGRIFSRIVWTAPLWLMACQEHSIGSRNSAPSVTINSHFDGDQVVEGFEFVVRATAGDDDGPPEDLLATWYVGNDLVPACNKMPVDEDGKVECTVVMYRDTDPPRVQVEVVDLRNATASDHRDLEVLDQGVNIDAPTAEIITPEDGSVVLAGEPTVFEGEVGDLIDPPTVLQVEWVSSLDGILSTAGADSSGTLLFVQPTLTSGVHVLELRVTDTEGNFTKDISTFTVNGAPTAPVVSISPSPAPSSQDLNASIDSASIDPEGDAISYTYEWLKDGVPQSGQTSALVLSSATRRGEQWTVRVRPFDGLSTGPFGEASVTIQNAAPVVQSITISPSPAYTNDVLGAVVVADDADGDTVNLTYDWHVNGVSTGQTGQTLDGLVHFDKGDVVQAWVTPNDGSTDGAQLGSNVLTIQNAPPTPPIVDISPGGPVEMVDDLVCSIVTPSTDPDPGDSVTYQFDWDVNGVPYPRVGDVGPSQTVWPDDTASGADTLDTQTWTCAVTAVDQTGLGGVPGEDSVVIGGYTFLPDYNGTFDIQPDVSFSCAGGLVNLQIDQLTFTDTGGVLAVGGAPVVMRQNPGPTDENFLAWGVKTGGCNEYYGISGSFTDADHFVGQFHIAFNGWQCSLTPTCQDNQWPVDGYRL